MKRYIPKKIIGVLYLNFILLALLIPNISHLQAQQPACIAPSVMIDGVCVKRDYKLLAPLPCSNEQPGCVNGKLESFDPKNIDDASLGRYLNIMIKILIGLCAVMAVVMIVAGGLQYMTSELVSSKEASKSRITEAVFGLILALGSWALLNTINPDLLNTKLPTLKDVTIAVTLNAADGGDVTEGINKPAVCGSGSTTPSAATGFCMAGTPESPKPSSGVAELVNFLKQNGGYSIMQMDISSNGTIDIRARDAGGTVKTFQTRALGFGANGISEKGQGQSGDMKTPKGNWSITEIRRAPDQSQRITNRAGQSMGGVAMMLNVGDRGIAIHGNSGNKTGKSAGCVLMSNDDLFALLPYVRTGTVVNIW
jgi:hypothetical protein